MGPSKMYTEKEVADLVASAVKEAREQMFSQCDARIQEIQEECDARVRQYAAQVKEHSAENQRLRRETTRKGK